jgi:hypothetical protein
MQFVFTFDLKSSYQLTMIPPKKWYWYMSATIEEAHCYIYNTMNLEQHLRELKDSKSIELKQ